MWEKRVEDPELESGLCLENIGDPCPSTLSPHWLGAPGTPLGFQCLKCQSNKARHAAG